MRLFHSAPKAPPANRMLELARIVCAEEGISLDPESETHFRNLQMPRVFHCGGSCPFLFWIKSTEPEQCPICGRRVSELVPDLSLKSMPPEMRSEIAAEVHMRYSSRCFREAKFAAAEASLTRVLELRPNFEDAYHNRAQVRNAMNRFAAAIEDCDAVMKINPKGADTLVTRAGLKLQTADLTGAIDDATRAIEMGSKKPFAYFVRGMARLQTNQVFPACGDLRLYLKLDPGAPRAAKVREILERFGGS